MQLNATSLGLVSAQNSPNEQARLSRKLLWRADCCQEKFLWPYLSVKVMGPVGEEIFFASTITSL